jgi:hypothetical protein
VFVVIEVLLINIEGDRHHTLEAAMGVGVLFCVAVVEIMPCATVPTEIMEEFGITSQTPADRFSLNEFS